jgi:hypothetical protein
MRSEEEKMLAGELYAAFDPALVAARTRTKQLLHRLNVTEYLLTDCGLSHPFTVTTAAISAAVTTCISM